MYDRPTPSCGFKRKMSNNLAAVIHSVKNIKFVLTKGNPNAPTKFHRNRSNGLGKYLGHTNRWTHGHDNIAYYNIDRMHLTINFNAIYQRNNNYSSPMLTQ